MQVETDPFTGQRQRMVEAQLRGRGIHDSGVLNAMGKVPRHEFVPEPYLSQAYDDYPIQIGEGQTISQPYIVARMLEALTLSGSGTVLEIGTGSGYQTALLAELSKHVYSIERLERLADDAKKVLGRLGYNNVEISVGDGSQGWPGETPFDAVVVSAAAPKIPGYLFDQMREGGRMIIPVGPPGIQELQLVRKSEGRPDITRLEACRFVPLVGTGGYSLDR